MTTKENVWEKLIELNEVYTTKINEFLSSLGIQVIFGDAVNPGGSFLIDVSSINGIENSLKGGAPEGSLCVVIADKYDGTEELVLNKDFGSTEPDMDFLKGATNRVSVYLRLGHTNTWLFFSKKTMFGLMFLDSSEVEDDDGYLYEEEDEATLKERKEAAEMGVQVAQAQGFGLLRNMDQRNDFVADIAKREKWKNKSDLFIGSVASNAAGYYDCGVLPLRARKLQEDGKTVAEIAKALGHTKNRIEKALASEPHAFTRNAMIANGFDAAQTDKEAASRDAMLCNTDLTSE